MNENLSSKPARQLLAAAPFLTLFSTTAHPAYACADMSALPIVGGIIFVVLFGPLILGGLLLGACEKIVFSGYGLLLGAGTFAIAAPFCMTILFQNIKYSDIGTNLLLLVTPGLLGTICMLVMSLRETKRVRHQEI